MKILLVSAKTENPKGGIAVWTKRYLDNCGKYGIDCELINTQTIGKRATDGTAKRSLMAEIKRTRRIFKNLKSNLSVCKDEKPVVHLNTSCGKFGLIRDYLIAKKVKKHGLKLITQFHCDIPYWVKTKTAEKYLKKLVRLSDDSLVLCKNSQNFLFEKFGAKSEIVPNFVEDDIIKNGSKQIAEQLTKAVFVGRIEKAKGALELFEVAKSFPDIDFQLIGELDETLQVIEKPENISFLGTFNSEKLIEKLDTADVFIFPTHSEGFSMALAEAMARGLPIIATDVGANREMIEDKGGIIVSVGNVEEMKSALEKLKSIDLRYSMSKWNLEKVRDYKVDCIINKFIKIYEI